MSNEYSRGAHQVDVYTRTLVDEPNKIVVIRQRDGLDDERDAIIELSPEQVPLLIAWLQEAASQAKGTDA